MNSAFGHINVTIIGYGQSQNAKNPIKTEDRKHPQIDEKVPATSVLLCVAASLVIKFFGNGANRDHRLGVHQGNIKGF